AWGKLQLPSTSEIEAYFYLASFIEFETLELPDISATAQTVAKLHISSMGASDAFGSPIPMYDGLFCHVNGWEKDWSVLFSKMLWQVYLLDESINGFSEECNILVIQTLGILVPRLLGHLDRSVGRIRPCFIHGDLWEGNIGKEVASGRHYIFGSNGYYGHHEMELAYWRTKHHKMSSRDYCTEYFKHHGPSDPASEVDDRIRLYGVKACLMYGINEQGSKTKDRQVSFLHKA
ncbi:Fructosamine/Ketosamine-3-kinase, partial [Lasiosphaeris hirsuta]